MNGIVILNYNNHVETINYAQRISTFDSIDYVVIVDNASSDDSVNNLLEIQNEKVFIVVSEENGGYNAGNNLGVKYSINELNCDKLIISNPDIIVSNDTCKKIFDGLNSKKYGIVAPLVYNESMELYSNCGWLLPSYVQSLMSCCLLTYKIQKILGKSNFFNVKDYDERYIPVEAVSGCFFGMTAEAYNSIKEFDEDNFLYGEEILLGAALKAKNFQIVLDKNCDVIHLDKDWSKIGIKKWFEHSKMLYNSHNLYLKKWLNCSKKKLFLYKIFFWIGTIVNVPIQRIRRWKSD